MPALHVLHAWRIVYAAVRSPPQCARGFVCVLPQPGNVLLDDPYGERPIVKISVGDDLAIDFSRTAATIIYA
jgi:hypothetical protein